MIKIYKNQKSIIKLIIQEKRKIVNIIESKEKVKGKLHNVNDKNLQNKKHFLLSTSKIIAQKNWNDNIKKETKIIKEEFKELNKKKRKKKVIILKDGIITFFGLRKAGKIILVRSYENFFLFNERLNLFFKFNLSLQKSNNSIK